MSDKLPLEEVVKDYISEEGDDISSSRKFPRYLNIAINGLRELYKYVGTMRKEVEVDIEDNDIIYLPKDYVNWIKLYVCRDGQQVAFGYNSNMCKPTTDSCGNVVVPQQVSGTATSTDLSEGFDLGTLKWYGAGAEYNNFGFFRVFPDEGYISLQQSSVGNARLTSVVLSYLADIDMIDGRVMVHKYDVEAVKAWIDYASKRRLRSYRTMVPMLKKDWQKAAKEAKKYHNMLSAVEIVQASNSGFMSAPKL